MFIPICAILTGSGKKTLLNAIAYDLGRAVRMIHTADLLAENVGNALSYLQSLVNDAKLADAVIAIGTLCLLFNI